MKINISTLASIIGIEGRFNAYRYMPTKSKLVGDYKLNEI